LRVGWSEMADAVITSFGYLHGLAPTADVVVDVRAHLYDPHPDLELRWATGLDEPVRGHVLAIAAHVAQGVAITLDELLHVTKQLPVTVAIGCAGGRHRSVVMVEEVARRLRRCEWQVEVRHLHIDCPVVAR